MKCSVCRRPISANDSLESGIGPTCREHRATILQQVLFEEQTEPKPKMQKRLSEDDVIDFDKLRGLK